MGRGSVLLADISAFKGMRYTKKAGEIETLVCPPYDIIGDSERESFLDINSNNVIRLELPKGEKPYEQAGETLKSWFDQDILKADMDPGFYIYELVFYDHIETGVSCSLKGLVCRVRLEEFENNVVLPHEETLSKAKEDRLNLMKATNSNFSQIYSLYQDEGHVTRGRIEQLTKNSKPRYEFDDGLVTHRLWVVNDRVSIEAIRQDFADRKLYIADGHHRYETALNYRNYCREQDIYNPGADKVMMFLADMADPGLVVHPTHRLVRGLEDFDSQFLLDACQEYFYIEEASDIGHAIDMISEGIGNEKKIFGFFDGSRAAVLTLKDEGIMRQILPDTSEAYRMLDVSILHSLILERLLGIDKENMAKQINLTYTKSVPEGIDSVRQGQSNCAFFLNATKVEEIGAVAANGEKMPQKSTYFYPKLTTGLVMNRLSD